MVRVELEELDNESDFVVYVKKVVDTITLREFKDYLNSLDPKLDHFPIVWENGEYGTTGGYSNPVDLLEIEEDRIFI